MRNARILTPTVLFPLIVLALVVVALVTSPKPTTPIIMRQIACLADSPDKITVVLQPTSIAIPDKVYNIEVRKSGVLRAMSYVSWTQQELQAKQAMQFRFQTTAEEYQFYTMDRNQLGFAWQDLSKEFTVLRHTETGLEIIPFSTGAPFNWWFIWIPLVSIVLLVVYMRLRGTKCPKCKRWYARLSEGSRFIGETQGYKTVPVTERHYATQYDGERNKIGMTEVVTKTNEQRHYIDRYWEHYYRCKFCGHRWESTSSEREE